MRSPCLDARASGLPPLGGGQCRPFQTGGRALLTGRWPRTAPRRRRIKRRVWVSRSPWLDFRLGSYLAANPANFAKRRGLVLARQLPEHGPRIKHCCPHAASIHASRRGEPSISVPEGSLVSQPCSTKIAHVARAALAERRLFGPN